VENRYHKSGELELIKRPSKGNVNNKNRYKY